MASRNGFGRQASGLNATPITNFDNRDNEPTKNRNAMNPSGAPLNEKGNKINKRHPYRNQPDICLPEELKISIHLAIERFRMNETQKELEFPSSFNAKERAYIHRYSLSLGIKSKSHGKGSNRVLTLTKKEGSVKAFSIATYQLARHSRHQIHGLLQRYPITNKERQDLQPRIERHQIGEVARELGRATTGRLNNGVTQVPPKRGSSDLTAFRESLPISARRDEILRAVNSHQVCLISGETGSGKTTQVPQMILDDCYARNKSCRIFCTQPRRIAALSIAERVAAERGERIGQTIGYQIRLESKVSPKTLLTFCTNGVLLRTLMAGDNALGTVTHIFIDEVHERDRFSDFLLIALRDLLPKYPNLKLILMSAALNTELFVKYFNNCPIVKIPGTLFEVKHYFLEDVLRLTNFNSKGMQQYKKGLAKADKQQKHLDEWWNKQFTMEERRTAETTPSPEQQLDEGIGNLEIGQEKEDLEPWLMKEMDQLLMEVFVTGHEDIFAQIFHLIASENVSVDYKHSETTATPLMVSAGRGFTDIVEQLLNLGANIGIRASNEWTALDWAKKMNQDVIVEMLEAHQAAIDVHQDNKEELVSGSETMSEEDHERLNIYHHSFDDEKVDIDLILELVHFIYSTQPDGAMLIFLPGYSDIVGLRDKIQEDKRFDSSRYVLMMLHSAMQSSYQKRVFKTPPPGLRKIILSTNIAETSVTINDIGYVIDSGKVKEKTYDALASITSLKCNWISKASALQRKGRAGRCRDGVCFYLFSQIRHSNMQEFQEPEILRYPLQELCIHTKLLAPVNCSIADFVTKAPQPPPFLVVNNAVQLLKQIDALDPWEDLTELGHHLADLPLEPRLGKMVLYSVVLKCLDPILTIVCALSYKDPFTLPALPYQRRESQMIRRKFSANSYSDHMTYLRAFQAWQRARTDGWERSFCEKNFLSASSLEMIVGMRTQLLGQLRASGFVRARGGGDIRDLNTNSENWPVIKAALCAGTYPNILRVDRDQQKIISRREANVRVHTTSVLNTPPSTKLGGKMGPKDTVASIPSDWILYEEMSRGHRLAFVQCCTVVSPITVAIFCGPAKLASDALKEPEKAYFNESVDDGYPEQSSDSEGDDRQEGKSTVLQLDDWLQFNVDSEAANLALLLRQKWYSLFLRRMRSPGKPWSQIDEAVVRAVISVLTNEEQCLGLQQPAGIGQRPRPMSAESLMSGSGHDFEDYTDNRPASRGIQKKTQLSPLKRSPAPLSKGPKGADDPSDSSSVHDNNSGPNSLRGSASSTPCASPLPSSPSKYVDKDPGANSPHPNRYFVMKCNNQKNLDISMTKGIWATTASNEKKLNKAFLDEKNVYLVFSTQGSGHFQGYAKMTSVIRKEKSNEFNSPGLTGNFSIQWIKRSNIPFQSTHHLANPWNENKKVQVSRDGQEIEPVIGDSLIKLWGKVPDALQRSSPTSTSRAPGRYYNENPSEQTNQTSPRYSTQYQGGNRQSQNPPSQWQNSSYEEQGHRGQGQSHKGQGHSYEVQGHPYGSRHGGPGSYPHHGNLPHPSDIDPGMGPHGMYGGAPQNFGPMGQGMFMQQMMHQQSSGPRGMMPGGQSGSPARPGVMILQRGGAPYNQGGSQYHHGGRK